MNSNKKSTTEDDKGYQSPKGGEEVKRGRVKKSATLSQSFIAEATKRDEDKIALPPRSFAPILSSSTTKRDPTKSDRQTPRKEKS